jgi:Flp pilus assembly protein TadG
MHRSAFNKASAQALVELALTLPVLAALVAVLFQFGIILLAYLSLLHAGRDVGRWIAVHPDTTDAHLQAYVTNHAPTTLNRADLVVQATPACAATTNGRCAGRPSGSTLRVRLAYDISAHLLPPKTLSVGFATFTLPTTLPPYDYHVMVENR